MTTPPIPGLNNRTQNPPAGAIVGGGSAVNGMFFDRGSTSDYDAWEALGNPGWSFTDILPYFKKSVTFTPPTPEVAGKYNYSWDIESAYGGNGPVQVSFPPYQFPGMGYLWELWKQLGITKQKEGANGNAFGVFSAPSSLDPVSRTRSYARTAHYDPVKNRTNYHLLTGYQATEIIFMDGLRAVGVNVVKKGTTEKIAIQAHRETILAAGALWTPWLLQRSGLGPSSILEAAGIPVKKEFPGVGANFQDHPFGGAFFTWTNNAPAPTQNSLLTNDTFYAEAEKEYLETQSGPLTVARGNQAAFLPLQTVDPEGYQSLSAAILAQDPTPYLPPTYDAKLTKGFKAQQRLTAELLVRNDSAAIEYPFGAGAPGPAALQRVLSRGYITLNTTSPSSPPLLYYRTFSNPLDMSLAIKSIRFARKLNAHPSLAGLGPVELAPGANVTDDAALEAYLRAGMAPTFAHASGSTSMLPEEFGGVVGPDLRVYGTSRLSVVDAGIMPFIPATHLCTTVYAVAEKGADLIKARTGW